MSNTKRVITKLATRFVFSICRKTMEGIVDLIEKLCDDVETVKGFCDLGNKLNARGDCERPITGRLRIGGVRFRECGELLRANRFLLKMKRKVYCDCVNSAILYGSET